MKLGRRLSLDAEPRGMRGRVEEHDDVERRSSIAQHAGDFIHPPCGRQWRDPRVPSPPVDQADLGLDSLGHLAAFPDGTGVDHVPDQHEAGWRAFSHRSGMTQAIRLVFKGYKPENL